jgi:hypothetical protein
MLDPAPLNLFFRSDGLEQVIAALFPVFSSPSFFAAFQTERQWLFAKFASPPYCDHPSAISHPYCPKKNPPTAEICFLGPSSTPYR